MLMCMSEHEKYEQVGRVAEEYSKVKGELNHVTEKLSRAGQAYQQVGPTTIHLVFQGEKLFAPPLAPYRNPGPPDYGALLNEAELKHAVHEKTRLTAELAELRGRLTSLAPHLL